MFIVGLRLYVSDTTARDRIGRYAFSAFAGFLLLIYVAERFSAPPPSVAAVAWTGVMAAVILLPWAWWFDRHRTLRAS